MLRKIERIYADMYSQEIFERGAYLLCSWGFFNLHSTVWEMLEKEQTNSNTKTTKHISVLYSITSGRRRSRNKQPSTDYRKEACHWTMLINIKISFVYSPPLEDRPIELETDITVKSLYNGSQGTSKMYLFNWKFVITRFFSALSLWNSSKTVQKKLFVAKKNSL